MNLKGLNIRKLVDGLKGLSTSTIADSASNWFKEKFMETNKTEKKSDKGYGKLSGAERLKRISVNIHAYYALFSRHMDLSEQYTKKGPGRKHKQGVQEYIPHMPEPRVLRGTVYPF